MSVGEAVKAQSRLLGLSRKSSGAQDRTWISTKGFCLQLWRKLGKVSDKHREVDGCGGSIASPHIKPKIPMQTPPFPPRSTKYIILGKVLFRTAYTADPSSVLWDVWISTTTVSFMLRIKK